MGRHLGISPIDLWLVEAGLDDRHFRVVGHQEMRHTADCGERVGVRADPFSEPLRPGCLDVGEVRGAHHRDENLRRPCLAGEPVDDNRHGSPAQSDTRWRWKTQPSQPRWQGGYWSHGTSCTTCLALGDMSARQSAPDAFMCLGKRAAGVDFRRASPSPRKSHPRPLSHPDYRPVLILIVALPKRSLIVNNL
jgi:hypothetical protein